MEEVLFKDVLSYITGWTTFIILVMLWFTYRIWQFGKKHPEIFQPDTTAEDKQKLLQKAELRRQYHNKSILAVLTAFVWVIGIVVICLNFDRSAATGQSWFLLVFATLAVIWIILQIKGKKK